MPVPGGINQQPWQPGNTTVYTQWVRWAEADMQPRTVEFSVRSGSKACSLGSRGTAITVNGMAATCGGPRFLDPAGTVAAGCQANDGTIFNECLWSVNVPRPGGEGWNGDVCVENNVPPAAPPSPNPTLATPPSPPSPRPPRPGGNPNINAPPLPPINDCLLSGVSSSKTPGGTECVNQANCLDVYYDSAKCEWRASSDGNLYLCEYRSGAGLLPYHAQQLTVCLSLCMVKYTHGCETCLLPRLPFAAPQTVRCACATHATAACAPSRPPLSTCARVTRSAPY